MKIFFSQNPTLTIKVCTFAILHEKMIMDKQKQYNLLVTQVKSLVEGEDDAISVMANVAALIHETMKFWWTGFYIVRNEELHLGPFQGPVACYRIKRGKGVCGTAWEHNETIVVQDVEQFPGHIACSSESRSEIVVPVRDSNGEVIAVLDIDSRELATFDDTDSLHLEAISAIIAPIIEDHR